jgi:hypothetical protein
VRALHHPRNSLLWRWAASKQEHPLLVYDLDDDIWGWNPIGEEYRYWNDERRYNAELNIQAADLVTTTNHRLAEVLVDLNPRIAVLPNTIPQTLLRAFENHRRRFIIGWQGAQQHVRDLQLIFSPVFRFMLRHSEVEFHLWGVQEFVDLPKGLAERVVCHPWQQSVWRHYFSLNMDIGLAPLDMTDRFNETRSDIRLREYAALGFPFIASRGVAYTQTAMDAGGMLASTEQEWEDHLEELFNNQNLRAQMSVQGRIAARNWTTENNARERERAYERAIYGSPAIREPRSAVHYRPVGITDITTKGRT